ncbi:MAG: patatin-like phospholipase family protein [Reyranellaceae bacterium]
MAETKRINLALQGGGSHGAFTWGVLDRLLEDGRLEFEGISGTSAGAMNAAVLAQGLHEGGREAARQGLAAFWEEIGTYAPFSPVRTTPLDRLAGNWNLDRSPGAAIIEMAQRLAPPALRNPLRLNSLATVLRNQLRTDAVQACKHVKLFVAATNVETGESRIFRNAEINHDALLASACLPSLFEAVMIDGQPYWDGGYMGNPAIWPFIYECESHDVVLVQINPLIRTGVPKTLAEIDNRLNEITFNGALIGEMRAIAFAQKLIEDDGASGPAIDRLKRMLIHIIADEAAMLPLGAVSKFNVEPQFLRFLHDAGRDAAERWLTATFDDLGNKSSVDIRAAFL